MHGVLLTLLLCFITASSRIFLKKGLKHSNALTGMVVSIVIGFLFLAALALPKLILAEVELDVKGVIIFALIGLVAPPIVRLLTYIGIDRVGVTRADPIRSAQPFFAILIAGLLLGENPGYKIWIATILIFTGVYILSRRQSVAEEKKYSNTDFLYPFLAALLAGAIAVARKYGMGFMLDPIVAAFIAATSAVFAFSLYLLIAKKISALKFDKKYWPFFLIAGVLTGITDIIDLMVLKISDIKIVAPLLASTPAFSVILGALFLKEEEVVTKYTWIGTVLIILAIQLIFWEAHFS